MLIDVEDLKLSVAGTQILDGVQLHVESGQIYGLIGPNGAGKSTTIAVLLGLYTADNGRVVESRRILPVALGVPLLLFGMLAYRRWQTGAL